MNTVLITGASSGIGKETARRLLAEGYTVYAAARWIENMKDLEAAGAAVIAMDIASEADVALAVERIAAEQGGVDILINNAGFGMYGAMEDTTIDDARRQFEVNLFGPARLTRLALPYMRRKRTGVIVNISPMAGKIPMPMRSWYQASKHALAGWSDCLRLELAPFGINVMVIEPGIIQTEFSDVMIDPMLERSGDTAYSDMARAMATRTRNAYESKRATPPSVIAAVVAGALKERRPRTRYAAGGTAKPLNALRRWFGDRMFDRAILSRIW